MYQEILLDSKEISMTILWMVPLHLWCKPCFLHQSSDTYTCARFVGIAFVVRDGERWGISIHFPIQQPETSCKSIVMLNHNPTAKFSQVAVADHYHEN